MRTLLIVLGCILVSCAPSKQFVDAVDGYTKVILPEYKVYIQEDSTLSDETKRIRTQSADNFQALIDEAKNDGN